MRITGRKEEIEALEERLQEAGFETHTSEPIFNADLHAIQEGVLALSALGGSVAALVKALAAYVEARKTKVVSVERDRRMEYEGHDPEKAEAIIEASRERGAYVGIKDRSSEVGAE